MQLKSTVASFFWHFSLTFMWEATRKAVRQSSLCCFKQEIRTKMLVAEFDHLVHLVGRGNLVYPLEKEMATHCSIPAWEIPWREEPGGLQCIGSGRVRHNLVTKQP